MYAKLFASLYQGTLRGCSDEILVFTNLLAHADSSGIVDKHWRAISEETGLSRERVEAAINVLQSPDLESRSPDEEGRRIVLIDAHRNWGWRVVNHAKYRAIRNEDDRREQNRLAQERWRNKQRNENKPRKPESAQAEAEAETDKTDPTGLVPETSYRAPNTPTAEIIQKYHEHLPRLPAVEVLTDGRKKAIAARWRQVCSDAKYTKQEGLDWFDWYFKKASTSPFLMGDVPGKSGRSWRADLDFLMNASSFAKVIEGRYHEGQK